MPQAKRMNLDVSSTPDRPSHQPPHQRVHRILTMVEKDLLCRHLAAWPTRWSYSTSPPKTVLNCNNAAPARANPGTQASHYRCGGTDWVRRPSGAIDSRPSATVLRVRCCTCHVRTGSPCGPQHRPSSAASSVTYSDGEKVASGEGESIATLLQPRLDGGSPT